MSEWYEFSDGRTMRREGTPCFWVLRGPNGEKIDRDQYRADMFERHGISFKERA
jgi:hypothetical protein